MTDTTADLREAYDTTRAAWECARDELNTYALGIADRACTYGTMPSPEQVREYRELDEVASRARRAFVAATAARAAAVRAAAGISEPRCTGCLAVRDGVHVPWGEDCRAAAQERGLSITADPD